MAYLKNEKIRVVVYTVKFRIEGHLYKIPGSRLTDVLNVKLKDFLALTEAKIRSLDGAAILAEAPYLAVYRDAIIAVHPVEEHEMLAEKKAAEETVYEEAGEE
jgi:hypothetical protein